MPWPCHGALLRRSLGACLGYAPGPFWRRSSGLGGMPWPMHEAMCETRGHTLAIHQGRFGGVPHDSGAYLGLAAGPF